MPKQSFDRNPLNEKFTRSSWHFRLAKRHTFQEMDFAAERVCGEGTNQGRGITARCTYWGRGVNASPALSASDGHSAWFRRRDTNAECLPDWEPYQLLEAVIGVVTKHFRNFSSLSAFSLPCLIKLKDHASARPVRWLNPALLNIPTDVYVLSPLVCPAVVLPYLLVSVYVTKCLVITWHPFLWVRKLSQTPLTTPQQIQFVWGNYFRMTWPNPSARPYPTLLVIWKNASSLTLTTLTYFFNTVPRRAG